MGRIDFQKARIKKQESETSKKRELSQCEKNFQRCLFLERSEPELSSELLEQADAQDRTCIIH